MFELSFRYNDKKLFFQNSKRHLKNGQQNIQNFEKIQKIFKSSFYNKWLNSR